MPLPEEASATILLALLARVRRGRGLAPWHLGWFKRIYCTYRYLQRLARVDGGRRHGAVIATSMPQLVRGLAPALGWKCTQDRFADRDRHHSSVRRWLEALEAAGLIRWGAGENEEGEFCRTEITLLPAAELEAKELAAAKTRWQAWRRRYGPGLETGAERCLGEVFARVCAPAAACRREIATRRGQAIRAAREKAPTVSAPPFGALPNGRENPPRSAQTNDQGPPLAAETGARAIALATGTSDDAVPGAIAPLGSGKEETASTERASTHSHRSAHAHPRAHRDRCAVSLPHSLRAAPEPAPADPLPEGSVVQARVAARLAASAWRRMQVARQARERAQALHSAAPGERHGLAALREAWVVYRFGTEIRPDFTTPESGAERVGDHGHADAGPRTAGQLDRAHAAIAAYERYADYRPAVWPRSGAAALCALAAQRCAETLDGDIARLACLARDMRATARHRDPARLERLRRRALRRVAGLRQALLPFRFRLPGGPGVETAEQRRERVRDELLLAGHDPGAWPNAAIAIGSIYSPATTGPTFVGPDPHAELDGTAARARRHANEQQRGLWNIPITACADLRHGVRNDPGHPPRRSAADCDRP